MMDFLMNFEKKGFLYHWHFFVMELGLVGILLVGLMLLSSFFEKKIVKWGKEEKKKERKKKKKKKRKN